MKQETKIISMHQNRKDNYMQGKKEFIVKEVGCSARPIIYDESKCIGCNRCASVCQCDILFPNNEKGKPPIVMYPGECYYCGACVMVCPIDHAISLQHPVMNQTKFVNIKN